jgi:phosphoribosylaminoimidazole-succinocarboxamide synthase
MVVRKLKMLPVEAIVRGYLTGSGWKDYQRTGQVSGIDLPAGLLQMSKFDEPIFTPSTKAPVGHDENIDFEYVVRTVGDRDSAERIRSKSLELYMAGAAYALERGIILVDTKFEFGLDLKTGELTLGDEVLTPDSSRYVAAETYEEGKPPKSMDKQIVRDYYEREHPEWDKTAPAPALPAEMIALTRECYSNIAQRLTGSYPLM